MAGPAGAQDTGKKIRYVYVDLGAPAFGVAVVAAMKVVVLTHFGHIDEAGGLASPGNTVSILHLGTLSLKNTVTVGLAPVSVAVNHNCNPPIAFVSNFGDNSVSVIRWDNPPNPAPSGLVGAGPQGVAVDPNPIDFLAYPCGIGVVANSLEQTLTVVDLSPSGPPSGPVAIGTVLHVRYPSGVAIHPRTHLALATDGFSPGKVIMIDITVPSAPKVGSRIPVGHTPSCIAIDQSRNLALVTNRGDHTLSVISLSPHADRGNTQPAKEIVRLPVGQEPFGVAIDEERGIGVVVNRQDKSLSLIRLDPPYSPSVLRTIPLKCIDCFPSGVAIVPESDVPGSHGSLRALVTDLRSDMLTVVDIPESMLYRQ
jgi:DNA-binding beta-propeller fold protein YncE